MIQTGIGYMVCGQLYKGWLLKVYKENQGVLKFWLDSDMITTEQYTEYLKIGEVISTFPVKEYQ